MVLADLVPGSVSWPRHRPLGLPAEISAGGVTRVETEPRPGAYACGTVRGTEGPLGDARVMLGDAAGDVVATTTTGDDGAYAFSDLDTGPYAVIATDCPAPGRRSHRLR